jgi:DNA anti-recombination protein RmuC
MLAEQKNGKVINNKAGYLSKAIQEDWGKPWVESEEAKAEKETKQREEEKEKARQKKEEENKTEKESRNIIEQFLSFDENSRKEIIKNFLNSLIPMIRTGVEKELRESDECLKKKTPARAHFIHFLKTYENGL